MAELTLDLCSIKANEYPCSRTDHSYNAQILEVLREWACCQADAVAPPVVRFVQGLASLTDRVTLADTITEQDVLLVTIDNLTVDHQNEALAGKTSWIVSGNQIIFSENLQFVTVRVHYFNR